MIATTTVFLVRRVLVLGKWPYVSFFLEILSENWDTIRIQLSYYLYTAVILSVYCNYICLQWYSICTATLSCIEILSVYKHTSQSWKSGRGLWAYPRHKINWSVMSQFGLIPINLGYKWFQHNVGITGRKAISDSLTLIWTKKVVLDSVK